MRRALLLIAAAALGLCLVRPAQAQSSNALTDADNGATRTFAVGLTVSLMLDPAYDWTFTVSDPSILQPLPIPLSRSLQATWIVQKPGQATISATGAVHCDPGMACILLAREWKATLVATGTGPAQPIRYPAGWNIVAAPGGSMLPLMLYGWDPQSGTYQQVGGVLQSGRGYWTYAAQDVNLNFGNPGAPSVCVPLAAGKWTLIGNPSGTAVVTVSGADAVYTYDPTAGAYQASTKLNAGQGAWAYSAAGGTAMISSAQPPSCPS
jgi:hypothetical protein